MILIRQLKQQNFSTLSFLAGLLLLRLFAVVQSQQQITTKQQNFHVRVGETVNMPCNLTQLGFVFLYQK